MEFFNLMSCLHNEINLEVAPFLYHGWVTNSMVYLSFVYMSRVVLTIRTEPKLEKNILGQLVIYFRFLHISHHMLHDITIV